MKSVCIMSIMKKTDHEIYAYILWQRERGGKREREREYKHKCTQMEGVVW
jgi:hypothetical protein